MNINASFNIPVMATLEVSDEDLAAAKAAGVTIPDDNNQMDGWELAHWLIKYWSSKASDFAIYDLVSDGEDERNLPELIQINDIDGAS